MTFLKPQSNRALMITGFNLTKLAYGQVVDAALQSQKIPFVISTLNVPLLKVASGNKKYTQALHDSSVIIPDGIGFVWASRLLYGKKGLTQRVTGPDLFIEFCKKADREAMRFFFLGSTPRVLNRIREHLQREFPNIQITGEYSPPFAQWDVEENKRIIEAVNKADADLLWVGMTAPKQELWIYQHKKYLRVKVIGAIGAAFDFFAGTRKRAPKWMRKVGLEWFYRVCQEPMRLGHRYFATIPFFIIRVLSHWLRGGAA